MKFKRQAAIVDLISRNEIKTQEELSDQLRLMGFSATQATISRDIKELQLVKTASTGGGYKYSTPDQNSSALHLPRLKNIFRECVVKVDRAQNLVVLKTLVGMANDEKIADIGRTFTAAELAAGLTVKKGKKTFHRVSVK